MKKYNCLIVRQEEYSKILTVEANSLTEAMQKSSEWSKANDISQDSNTLDSQDQYVKTATEVIVQPIEVRIIGVKDNCLIIDKPANTKSTVTIRFFYEKYILGTFTWEGYTLRNVLGKGVKFSNNLIGSLIDIEEVE